MPSLVEAFGSLGTAVFVPANVISAQAQTQADLQQRADLLNSNAPGTLAVARQSGILTDGTARQSMQDMNRALFAVDNSQRDLGLQIVSDVTSSAAAAPSTLINYGKDQVLKPAAGLVKDTVQSLIPWQLWLIVGLALVVGVGIFSFVKAKT